MSARAVALVVLVLAVAAPSFAGDIVAMPTGNTVAPKNLELNYIWWKQDFPSGPGHINVGEAFIGVCDRVEVDVDYAGVSGGSDYTEANLYLTVLREDAKHPSLIVGATNVFGSRWLGDGMVPDADKASFFAVSAFNLTAPATPTWNTPLVRAQLGYGNHWHDGWFGGLQIKIAPEWGAALFNYKHKPVYIATYDAEKWLELSIGAIGGEPFYRAGGFLKW